MPRIITIKYECRDRISLVHALPGGEMMNAILMGLAYQLATVTVPQHPGHAMWEAADQLAAAYIAHAEKADFGIVDSQDVSWICAEHQSFFPKIVEEAMKKQGATVSVDGLVYGSLDVVLEQTKQLGGDLEFLDGIQSANHPTLYRFERSHQ